MTGSSKPTVFLSSTIRDFADLRSALKYWLEESGFEVWLSEYNDMEKSPGANTFDACLASIRKANFYILLIGTNKGSLYNEQDDVSITQQEYRVAYDSFVARGHPIPLLFVRARVKDMLSGWALGDTPEPFPFPDAPFINRFVAEVTRERESSDAVRGIGPYPVANWLHAFHDFRDVADALKVALSLRVDVSRERLLSSMEMDLEITLSALFGKRPYRPRRDDPALQGVVSALVSLGEEGEAAIRSLEQLELDLPHPLHRVFTPVISELALDVDSSSGVRLDPQQSWLLSQYLIGRIASPDHFRLRSVRDMVASGMLLRYDPETRSFQKTDLTEAASEVVRQAEHYEAVLRIARPLIPELVARLSVVSRQGWPGFDLAFEQALSIWGLYSSQENLYRRVASLYAYLRRRKDSPLPDSLLPTSPFGPAMDERIERERASRDDIREWSGMFPIWKL